MLRKFTALLAPTLGLVAVVGAGFSAWYFGVNDVTKDVNMSVELTELADGTGEITVTDTSVSLKLVLDQGGFANKNDVTKGISVVNTNSNDAIVSDLAAQYTISQSDYDELNSAGTLPTITTTITIPSALANYVTVKTSSTWVAGSNTASGDKTFVRTSNFPPSPSGSEYVVDLNVDMNTSDGVNELFQYVTGQKPTDTDAYNSMSTALTSVGKVVITFAATFADNV